MVDALFENGRQFPVNFIVNAIWTMNATSIPKQFLFQDKNNQLVQEVIVDKQVPHLSPYSTGTLYWTEFYCKETPTSQLFRYTRFSDDEEKCIINVDELKNKDTVPEEVEVEAVSMNPK